MPKHSSITSARAPGGGLFEGVEHLHRGRGDGVELLLAQVVVGLLEEQVDLAAEGGQGFRQLGAGELALGADLRADLAGEQVAEAHTRRRKR
jgi:hypothetical protein